MSWYYAKLRFTSPVRLGSDVAGVGLENVQRILHADTLFSALCNVWARHRIVDVGALGGAFRDRPPFRLSSAFPFMPGQGSGFRGEIYFLPKPLLPTRQFEHISEDMHPGQTARWRKAIKQARYVPANYFKDWRTANPSTPFLQPRAQGALDAWRTIFVEETRPQHAQDRLTQASQLYHVGRLVTDPEENAGLYFLAQLPEEEPWKTRIDQGLKLLSDEGLGGERSTGLGRFTSDAEYGVLQRVRTGHALHFLTEQDPTARPRCLLSLFHPTEAERSALQQALNADDQDIAYSLVRRKGWTYSTSTLHQVKRKTVMMFGEGSTFGHQEEQLRGRLIDLKPEFQPDDPPFPHPIWRYGIALTVSLPT